MLYSLLLCIRYNTHVCKTMQFTFMAYIHIIISSSSSSSTNPNMLHFFAGKCFGWRFLASELSFFLFLRFPLTYFLCLRCAVVPWTSIFCRSRPTTTAPKCSFSMCTCSVHIYSCTYYYHHHLWNLCTKRWFASMFKSIDSMAVGIEWENSIIYTF